MASLPPSRGRRRATALETQQSKSTSSTLSLPPWCSGFRKEALDSERAYDERVTTSTKTSEIRLRQESIRYWNRFLEEAQAAAFAKIVRPTCNEIKDVLLGAFDEINRDSGEKQEQHLEYKSGEKSRREDYGMDDSTEMDRSIGITESSSGTIVQSKESEPNSDDDWEYCQQLFGLPSASIARHTSATVQAGKTDAPSTASAKSKSKPLSTESSRVQYPLEVLPVFVIDSPLISNCFQDRSKICYSMWRQLNGLEDNSGQSSFSTYCDGDRGRVRNGSDDDKTICIYMPRLLSSLTETLQVLWDGLLYHYENTHDAPSMDPDDPHYYSNPNELASKRHSYHVSKRRHYEALLDRKVTTETQKSKTGTKKQQSLQDFILEFLSFIYEEPKEFSTQERHEKRGRDISKSKQSHDGNENSRRNHTRHGNLILLLEDPRILHPKVATAAGQSTASSTIGGGGKPNNSNVVQSQLLETLATWRGTHGIPVSLVVFNSVGSKREIQQNNVLLNPSFESNANGSRFGVQTLRCSIPSASNGSRIPPYMAFGLWSHYFLQSTMETPMPLLAPQLRGGQKIIDNSTATTGVLQMCQDALKNGSSCSKLVSSIRDRLVAGFYTRKGSFVWDALNPKTTAMMRSTSLISKPDGIDGIALATDNENNSSSGGSKDQQLFAIGNDDVQIFQPGIVAWFSSYHKAHALLSSQAGDCKSAMASHEKCEALLKSYWCLKPPVEVKELLYQENEPKRRKVSKGDCDRRGSNDAGILQFWWSISCSLLPLYFVSLTVANEQMALSSKVHAPNRPVANESLKKMNVRQLEDASRWIIERLVDVYRQLLSVLGDEKTITMVATTSQDSRKSVSEKLMEDHSESRDEETRNSDLVEATLRRYLQRGMESNSSDKGRNGKNQTIKSDTNVTAEVHRQSIRRLTNMVREFIVLVDAFSIGQKGSQPEGTNEENELTRDYKIRLGMRETMLEMTRFALDQTEAWTRRWVDFNPLMAESEGNEPFDNGCLNDHTDDPSRDIVDHNSNMEGRPVNLRRKILNNLPPASRKLYEILEGRLSVDRDDWFYSFGGSVEDFAVGVWTLRKCGLIRPKKTKVITATHKHERGKGKKRQEIVSYEKVAVVWC